MQSGKKVSPNCPYKETMGSKPKFKLSLISHPTFLDIKDIIGWISKWSEGKGNIYHFY